MDYITFAVGLSLMGLVLIALEAGYRAATSPEKFFSRLELNRRRKYCDTFYSGIVGAGAFVFLSAGVYGLLFWLPAFERSFSLGSYNSETTRVVVSFLVGLWLLAALSKMTEAIDELQRLRTARATLKAAKQMISNLAGGATHDEAWSRFSESDESLSADMRWMSEVLADLEREALENNKRAMAAISAAQVVAARSGAERQVEAKAALSPAKSLDEVLPAIVEDCSNEITGPRLNLDDGRYVVSMYTLISEWRPFSDAFSIGSITADAVQRGAQELDLTEKVSLLPGVHLQQGINVIARYTGSSHDGKTDFIVRYVDGTEAPLCSAVTFAQTLSGALGAFYFAHILPTKGRFWHGLYNYDYRIFLQKSSLTKWLSRSGFTGEDAAILAELDHPASVCVSVFGEVIEVSAYGAGETTPLSVFRASLEEGRLKEVSRNEVLKSKVLVLY